MSYKFNVINLIIMSVLGFVFSFSSLTYANVIEIDSPFGNSTAFVDTNTGLQWLDLSVTFNQELDYVKTELRNGGRYQGFRYASLSEVSSLLIGLGLEFSEGENKSNLQFQILENFLISMGVTSGRRCCDAATIRPVYGVTSNLAQSPNPDDPTEYFWASYLQTTAGGYQSSPVNTTYNAAWVEPQSTRFRSDQTNMVFIGNFIGSWLIHDVPEPSSMLLILSVLTGWILISVTNGRNNILG